MTPMSERKGLVERWRKKTTIEAVQWFANGHCPVWAQAAVEEAGDRFTIRTREGVLTGIPGDWIARGIEGEVYPIGADIFAKTYEPATLLSSDARPAPMPEEVKASMTSLSELFAEPETDEGYRKNWADVVAHIDHLTRKVAEATDIVRIVWTDPSRYMPASVFDRTRAFLAGQPLSRPQETDAVLAEREGCELDVLRERAKWPQRSEGYIALTRAAERVRSRPSPGPATETERENEAIRLLERLRFTRPAGTADPIWDELAVLLASVRPKQEGV